MLTETQIKILRDYYEANFYLGFTLGICTTTLIYLFLIKGNEQ